jgi:TATA-box binding protein (TBP) (component of TFIID and TFIIIB)
MTDSHLKFKHSELKLVTSTCTSRIKTRCNVEILGNYIDTNEHVLGVKYINSNDHIIPSQFTHILKGRYIDKNDASKPKKKSSRKEKVTKRKDFSNQCSIIIQDSHTNDIANVKIFRNGNLVITGIKTSLGLDNIIEYIRDNVIRVHGHMEYYVPNTLEEITTTFKNSRKVLTMYDNAIPQIHSIVQQIAIEKHLQNPFESDDPLKLKIRTYFWIFMLIKYFNIKHIFNLISNIHDTSHTSHTSHTLHTLHDKLSSIEQRLMRCITKYLECWNDEKNAIIGDFSSTLDNPDCPPIIKYTQIESINSTFNVNFNINRLVLNNILNDKYKLTKEQIQNKTTSGIVSSQFNPTVFHGINITYRVVFDQFDQLVQFKKSQRFNDKYTDMKYRDITIFIFRNGKMNITSMVHEDRSDIIQNFSLHMLNDEYEQIFVDENVGITQTKNEPEYLYILDTHDQHMMYVRNSLIQPTQ